MLDSEVSVGWPCFSAHGFLHGACGRLLCWLPLRTALMMWTIHCSSNCESPFSPWFWDWGERVGVGVLCCCEPSLLNPHSLQEVFLDKTSNCSIFEKYHPCNPETPLLGISTREMCTYIYQRMYVTMSIAIHNSTNLETTKMPINCRMDK